jgi:hypothetical protein
MRIALCLILGAAATAAACDAPPAHRAVAATPAAVANAPARNGLIPGTPPGDLGDWVHDIRQGIATLPDRAAKDAAAAQRGALDLYVTRQEYSEMYYGVDGRIRSSAELATAIETAEARFHELLKLLTASNPEIDAVQSAVDALDKQQSLVARLWKETGVRLRRTTP